MIAKRHLNTNIRGRDGALSSPRRVQRRNTLCAPHAMKHSLSPLHAGWDGAARRPYLHVHFPA
jgi:hypothetical protein